MDKEREQKLNELIDACWAHYQVISGLFNQYLPPEKKSIPILWFGDTKAYNNNPSGRKIITVGLNPSEMEFRAGKSFSNRGDWSMWRFSKASSVALHGCPQKEADYIAYRTAFDEYFTGFSKKSPTAYKKWFSNWNGILEFLEASFDPAITETTVIHTDFRSPLATTKGWGQLSGEAKTAISEDSINRGLWSTLVTLLKPNLILTCNEEEHVREMLQSLHFDTKNSYIVESTLKYCSRGPDLPIIHSWGVVSGQTTHLFAAPVKGTPWKGWHKCILKDFAKEIEKTV